MANSETLADRVEQDASARIAPSPELLARVAEVRLQLVRIAEAAAKERSSPLVRAIVAGSAARGTFLSDRFDFDLFLLFPTSLDRAGLEAEGMAIGRAILTDPETRYAQHPYLRGRFGEFSVEAVPGYAVTDGAHPMTAVDRTPFHQAWLAERETPELVAQVRLAKQFLRAHGIYGSEAKTGGFSGYLVELLVLKFGGFRPLLAAARAWTIPVHIAHDPKAKPRVPDDVALVVDDPVDPARNVSTALTRRNLALFILAAERYLTAPEPSAFLPTPTPLVGRPDGIERTKRRATHVAVLTFARPKLVDDILYPQLQKAERAVAGEAERIGFDVLGTASAAGEGELVVLVEVGHRALPAVQVRSGPPVGVARSDDFLGKWASGRDDVVQGPYLTDDGKLAVETIRAERQLESLLSEAWPRLPVGKDLRAGPAPSVRPLAEVADSPALQEGLTRLLDKRLPWVDRGPAP
ncbi:MAG TPA: CCA tRNA nucleotidyltransferase [Thermoplasmata archaeon]|nr:CCA tRNA nucleotidyltransferase [Thermoplasmata archaeon]